MFCSSLETLNCYTSLYLLFFYLEASSWLPAKLLLILDWTQNLPPFPNWAIVRAEVMQQIYFFQVFTDLFIHGDDPLSNSELKYWNIHLVTG